MMRRFLKRCTSIMLTLVLIITLMPYLPMRRVEAATYSAQKAVDYAIKYAKKYNPAYVSFPGHDCSNFVSQCLVAGGLPQDSVWNPNAGIDPQTGYNDWRTTALKDYLINKGYQVIWNPSASQILPGNPVFYSYKSKNDYATSHEGTAHAAICVSNSGGNAPIIAAHTTDYDSQPHSSMMSVFNSCCTIIMNGGNVVPSSVSNSGLNNSFSANPDDHAKPTVTISARYNSRANGVTWIQAILKKFVNSSLVIDGVYGSNTASAVRSFQTKYGLEVDGVTGPKTIAKMADVWVSSKVVNPSSISISPTDLSLTVGKSTAALAVNIGPSNATNKNVTWSSSNNSVATVNNGVVKAVKAGSAVITASTFNNKTASCKVTVHDACQITFVNEDGSILNKQVVDYGASAVAPQNPPEKTGYTFSGWSGTYQNVKSSATITAVFKKNIYKVTFKETNGTPIGKTQNVAYNDAAVAPDTSKLSIPAGYTFKGWSDSFEHVSSEMTIYPVYEWADKELPMVVSNATCVDNNDGTYYLTFKLANHSTEKKNVRLMSYMITNSGMLVAQGETRTVSIPAAVNKNGVLTNGEKEIKDLYIVCNLPADKARVVVLDDYESAVPLAEMTDITVQAAGYSNWSDTYPTGKPGIEMRTLYRSKNVKYTTSTSSTLSGWTKYNSMVTSYTTNNDKYYYGNGRSATPPASTNSRAYWAEAIYYSCNPSAYTVPTYNISITTTGGDTYRSMVRWIQSALTRLGYSTTIDGVFGSNTAAVVKRFQSAYGLSADGIVGAATRTALQNGLNAQPLYNYYYHTKTAVTTYYFYQTDSAWSGWSEKAISGDKTITAGTTKVLIETKNQYRYKQERTGGSIVEGQTVKPECKLPAEAMGLAGKSAMVIVFKNKVNQIAEDNVEYVGMTNIGNDGALNISFVPREAQTYDTGDYTVVLGVKGTSNYVTVGKMSAPKPVYQVSFVDEKGNELSKQEIEEGKNAEIPEAPEKEGYTFVGWDTGTTNVHADMTVTAQYKKNQYTVTYVDWENTTLENETYEYEDIVTLPETPSAPEGMEFVGWGIDENTKITKDMICVAEYKKQEFTVSFVDWEGNVVLEETVEYGDSAVSPEVVEAGEEKAETVPDKIENMSFVSWGEDIDLSAITTNLVVGAMYQFDETVEKPEASLTSGEYNTQQSIQLTCATKDVIIYYSLDGSDPTDVENTKAVKVYDGSISLTESAHLKFYATKMGMNDSAVSEAWYCINTTGNKPKHLLSIEAVNQADMQEVTGYYAFIDDGKRIDLSEVLPKDYETIELEGIYYDREFTEKWQAGSQTITESLNLYARYVAKKFTVTYLDSEKNVYKTEELPYGALIEEEGPEKAGYRFAGWVGDDGTSFVTKDVTVMAKYVVADKYALIKFTRNSYSIVEDSMFKLTPKVTYDASESSASDEVIKFSSSNETIAVVDSNGMVTALTKGEVTITATVLSSGEYAECKLIITGNPEKSVCLYSNSSYQLADGYLRRIEIGKNQVETIKKQINAEHLRLIDEAGDELEDDDLVGTGTRVQLLDGENNMLDEVTVIIVGDYNGDGLVTGKDVSGIIRCLLGKETADNAQLRAMDVNGDGNVNNRDASMLARYLVGKEGL